MAWWRCNSVRQGWVVTAFVAQSRWLRDENLRLDAGTYANGGLAARDRINNIADRVLPLDRVARIFSGARFARTFVVDRDRGTPYLNGTDMLQSDLNGLLLLSNARTPQIAQLLIQSAWTLMSCSGTIGRTVFVRPEMHRMVGSHDIIRLVPDDVAVYPGYLFAFLSSAPAQAMIKQRTYGSVVQHIEPHHIADIPVPLMDDSNQRLIHHLVWDAAEKRTEASRLIEQACAYFDAFAGEMPSCHDHDFAVGLVGRRLLDGRLDAFNHIGWAAEGAHLSGTALGDLARISRPPIVKRTRAERGVPFLTGTDLYQVRPTFRQRITRRDAQQADCLLNEGLILVQRSGQRYGLIGRPAHVGSRLVGWAASEDLIRVAPTSKDALASVFAFLSSSVGRRAVLRTSYGTSIPHLKPEALSRICIPALQPTLVKAVGRALVLRNEADIQEEQAIQEVERWLG